jgi:flagellar biosynthesis/type III secretory pathway chaperone
MIDKLKDIINVQLKLMEELLSILNQEKTALLDIDLDALAEIDELKKNAIVDINTHTNPLRETVEAVATDSGLPSNTPFVEVVIKLGKQGIMDIPRLYQDLNGLAIQVREAAALNQEIAEHSVAMIKNALLILAIVYQSTTYDYSGGYYQWQVDAIMINHKV